MASVVYRQVFDVVSSFIGKEKAELSIGRQLQRCQATPDTLSSDQLKQVLNFLIGGTTLYLHPDEAKKQALTAKLKSLA